MHATIDAAKREWVPHLHLKSETLGQSTCHGDDNTTAMQMERSNIQSEHRDSVTSVIQRREQSPQMGSRKRWQACGMRNRMYFHLIECKFLRLLYSFRCNSKESCNWSVRFFLFFLLIRKERNCIELVPIWLCVAIQWHHNRKNASATQTKSDQQELNRRNKKSFNMQRKHRNADFCGADAYISFYSPVKSFYLTPTLHNIRTKMNQNIFKFAKRAQCLRLPFSAIMRHLTVVAYRSGSRAHTHTHT